MSLLLTPALALLGQGIELKTDYPAERALKVLAETTIEVETTDFSMERDGEPMESRWGGGGGGSSIERVIAYVDTVVESEGGRPTKVTRKFGDVELTGSMGSGERAREIDRESPLDGETVVLTLDGDDVVAELESGEPDDASVLQGHHLRLPLDGLLPGAEVEDGDTWEPEAEGLLEAMLLDVEAALFPRPTGDGGGGGEGRRGGRGGRGGGGGVATGFMRTAEWEIEAELTDARDEVDGVECVVIELTCEADGDLPERTFGRGGRELSLAPYSASFTAMLRDNTYEVELAGKLWFSAAEKRPVKLELEGEFTLETGFERERDGSTMSMSQTQEGELELVVTIEEAD